MAHPERFERPTLWFVARYSIQLSYGCAVKFWIIVRLKFQVKLFRRKYSLFVHNIG